MRKDLTELERKVEKLATFINECIAKANKFIDFVKSLFIILAILVAIDFGLVVWALDIILTIPK